MLLSKLLVQSELIERMVSIVGVAQRDQGREEDLQRKISREIRGGRKIYRER